VHASLYAGRDEKHLPSEEPLQKRNAQVDGAQQAGPDAAKAADEVVPVPRRDQPRCIGSVVRDIRVHLDYRAGAQLVESVGATRGRGRRRAPAWIW